MLCLVWRARQPLPCALRSSATLARVGHATDIKPRLLDPGLCLSFHLSLLFTGYEASPRSCLTLSAFPEQSHSKEYLLTVRNFVQVTASLLDGKDRGFYGSGVGFEACLSLQHRPLTTTRQPILSQDVVKLLILVCQHLNMADNRQVTSTRIQTRSARAHTHTRHACG